MENPEYDPRDKDTERQMWLDDVYEMAFEAALEQKGIVEGIRAFKDTLQEHGLTWQEYRDAITWLWEDHRLHK